MTAHDLRQPPNKYRLRVADYLTLAEAGAFQGLETELIEGDVIVMSPEFRPHMFVKDELAYLVRCALEDLGSALSVGTTGSVPLSDTSMPRPDIVLTSERRGEGAVPLASIALVIEVASTTLSEDMGVKARLYARNGIPEYWVADVSAQVIHQMWAPRGDAYAERRKVAFGERIAAAMIEGLAVETAGI